MNTFPEAPKLPCSADAPIYRAALPYLRAGTLSPAQREALRRHLLICAPCREQAALAADQVVEGAVLRHYSVPANAAPFLTLDDIRRRASTRGADEVLEVMSAQREPAFQDGFPGLLDSHERGKNMALDDTRVDTPTASDTWARPPIKPPNRWRAAVAVVATVAIIALFALLLRGFVAGKGASGPAGTSTSHQTTATAHSKATQPATGALHGQWNVRESMAYTTQTFTQTPYPVFSPKDPAIVYETTLAPITVRRSDNGGSSWKALMLPKGSDQAIDIEIFASPLNADTAFLTVTTNLAYGQGPAACPTSPLADASGATHGNMMASGQIPCSITYRTTNEGATWTALTFPIKGSISTPLSDSAPYAGTLIQSQGSRLYALLDCGPTCVSPGNRLVVSADGGVNWQVADGGVGQGVCDYAAQPDGQTVFTAISNGGCDVLNTPALSLYRSDNAGGSWTYIGNLPKGASQGMAAVVVGGKPLLILNLPAVTWQPHIIGVTQSADEFRVSRDGGRTWTTAPLAGVPAKAQPVVGPLIVRSDGSLVVAFTDATGQGAKLYSWKLGQAGWLLFIPPPSGQLKTLLHTTSPTGAETFWAVMQSGSVQQTNNMAFTFTVASYQP